MRMEPTPEAVLREFNSYRMSYRDTLGEFLAHYHRRWLEASEHGVSGMKGIIHMISLLPPRWGEWAASIMPEFICTQPGSDSLYGNFREFVATISNQYYRFSEPPPEPYHPQPRFTQDGLMSEPLPQDDPVPFALQPLAPVPDPTFQQAYHAQSAFDTNSFISQPPSPIAGPISYFLHPDGPSFNQHSATPFEAAPYHPYSGILPSPNPSDPSFPFSMYGSIYPHANDYEAGSSKPHKEIGDEDNADADSATEVPVGTATLRHLPFNMMNFESIYPTPSADPLDVSLNNQGGAEEEMAGEEGGHEEEEEKGSGEDEEEEPMEENEKDPSEADEEEPFEGSSAGDNL